MSTFAFHSYINKILNSKLKMKKLGFLVTGAALCVCIFNTSCSSGQEAKLRSEIDSVSYAIGLVNGDGFKQSLQDLPGEALNVDDFLAGFILAMKGKESSYKMTVEDAQSYIQNYFMRIQMQKMAEMRGEGEAFLAENQNKEGVITTESGLQYKVITEGKGEKPVATDRVKAHYTGTLLDGTKFDSSIDRGEPMVFELNRVIPGWTEGLQLMSVGSKYIFWIPSDLAYGERGAGDIIAPNSTLIFEVELLEIVKE